MTKTTVTLIDSLKAARFYGLSSISHILAIVHLRDAEVLRLTDLARRLSISTAAVTQVADHLVAHSLAYRERGVSDRRVIHLRITRLGVQVASVLSA